LKGLESERLRVALLGFTLPEDDIKALGTVAAAAVAQTHNFAWSLVSALTEAGCAVTLLSTLPVRDFPTHSALVIGGKRFASEGISPSRSLGFVNVILLKHVSRFLSCVGVGRRHLIAFRAQILLIHGSHLPFLWFAAVARRLLRVRTVAVLTDPPGVVLPADTRVMRLLRSVDRRLVRTALRGIDGVVCLTDELGAEFAPHAPRLVMEGIVNPKVQALSRSCMSRPDTGTSFKVAYAGALKETYGIQRLVNAVLTLPEDVSLDIYGTGSAKESIERTAASCSRIRYHGPLPHSDLMEALLRADLLVNPRPVDQGFVRYSFPSKLIEYMALGRPVLTTHLPGIPGAYAGKVRFAYDDSVEGLAKSILDAWRCDRCELEAMAQEAQQFVTTKKSSLTQGRRIRGFLVALLDASSKKVG
jgi:glycosyltransferase involved in cell wall biosynthesis